MLLNGILFSGQLSGEGLWIPSLACTKKSGNRSSHLSSAVCFKHLLSDTSAEMQVRVPSPFPFPFCPCWGEFHDKHEPRPQLRSGSSVLRRAEDKICSAKPSSFCPLTSNSGVRDNTTNGAFSTAWGYRGAGGACTQLELLSCQSCWDEPKSITHLGRDHGTVLGTTRTSIPLPQCIKAEWFWLGCREQGSD